MLEIENDDVVGWDHAIRGMRNPMNSWDKSDSEWDSGNWCDVFFRIGEDDLELMGKLAKAGTDHSKFLRMIVVYADITAPMYWWKEFDTYKVGTVRNSCSTMHKIHSKEFTIDDFSHEHLFGYNDDTHDVDEPLGVLNIIIDTLNDWRKIYIEEKDKDQWWQMIQLLPSSYNQKSTVMLNYQVLRNIYHSRRNHKLDEWHTFCDWIETLPHSELITSKGEK